jgi:hypothetical protein
MKIYLILSAIAILYLFVFLQFPRFVEKKEEPQINSQEIIIDDWLLQKCYKPYTLTNTTKIVK